MKRRQKLYLIDQLCMAKIDLTAAVERAQMPLTARRLEQVRVGIEEVTMRLNRLVSNPDYRRFLR